MVLRELPPGGGIIYAWGCRLDKMSDLKEIERENQKELIRRFGPRVADEDLERWGRARGRGTPRGTTTVVHTQQYILRSCRSHSCSPRYEHDLYKAQLATPASRATSRGTGPGPQRPGSGPSPACSLAASLARVSHPLYAPHAQNMVEGRYSCSGIDRPRTMMYAS